MSDNIPFEIQVEIMKRLPVESLAVFRSVSKAWKSVIDSPRFITNHTNMRQHHRLLIRYIDDNDFTFEYECKYLSVMDNDTLSRQTVSNVPVSFELLKKLELVGTSQGLFCLFRNKRLDSCCKESAVIWNPSLRKSIAIDVPCGETYEGFLGFGVHPDNCDPMIVMIKPAKHHYQAMVFTLSSRVWKFPRGNLPSKSIYFDYFCPTATNDRCIYWKASERSINLVVAFDMVSEDFTEIDLPHSVANRFSNDFSISKLRESLALLEYDSDAERPVYGVWMMVEDGVLKSFTKLFTINTPDASLRTNVLGFTKNDQAIMDTTKDDYWVSASLEVYEPSTGTIKNLGINGVHNVFFCCSYMESLLLLNQLDEQFVETQLQL